VRRGRFRTLCARAAVDTPAVGRSSSSLAAMDDYSAQWHHYRILTRVGFVAFAVFLGAIPLALGLGHVMSLTASVTKTLSIICGVVAVLAFWITLLLIGFWRCPRCHGWYSRRHIFSTLSLGRRCIHCGLGLYEGEAMSANQRLERQ
jgi:hypothetical protein